MKYVSSLLKACVGTALVSMVALSGWSAGAFAETTLERVMRDGVIRVGFANEAPFGYATAAGKLTGEAPEVARRILGKIGDIKMEGVLTEFGSLIPGLKAGRFDMIAAGMYILPKRCKEILFSNPTYGLGQGFVVKAGNPKNLHSFDDVAKNPDATLVVVAGGVERDYARETGVPDNRVLVVPDFPTATAAVQTGRGDALALTSLSVQNIIDTANDPNLERAKPYTDPVIGGASVRGFGGFGFRKGDEDLRGLFNKYMADFIGSQAHLDLVSQFGFSEADMPGDVTTAQLCAG